MAYQALYRVWRSQRFEDIVGQKAITQTLKNAIAQKKTSHAYLFTGPRGTGKTSAAKIFAKAINCQHSVDGEPCNECEICQSITEGRCNDVIEIDAASNNGVEEIRDIREKVKYAPTEAEFKVYIIDEVHMLSTGAFNALLKTLEEPPKNVIFILATTEPHKIPLTIISRTQRFDFKRISTQDIVDHMAEILESMNITYDQEALYIIARAAEGGMRDALSILDQGISFGEGHLTVNDAIQVTGSLTSEMMDNFLGACSSGDTEKALEVLESLMAEGKEGRRFLEDLLLYCRDLLMQQQAPQLLTAKSGQVSPAFQELAQQLPAEKIYQYIQILNDTQQEIRFTNNPNIYLEVATVKLSSASGKKAVVAVDDSQNANIPDTNHLEKQIHDLQKEVRQLQSQLAKGEFTPATSEPAKPKPQRNGNTNNSYRLPTESVYQVLKAATRNDLIKVKEVWGDLLHMLPMNHKALFNNSEVVAASGEAMVLAFDYEIFCQRAVADEELMQEIRNSLYRLIKYEPNIVCIPKESWGELRSNYLQQNPPAQANGQSNVETENVPVDAVEFAEAPDADVNVVDQAVEIFGADNVVIMDD